MGLFKRKEALIQAPVERFPESEQQPRSTCAYAGGYSQRPHLKVAMQDGKIATTNIIHIPERVPAECEGQIIATDAPYVRMTDTGRICVKAELECAREDCPAMEWQIFAHGFTESYVEIDMVEQGSTLEDGINGSIIA